MESHYNENQNKLESFSRVYFTLDSNYKFKSKTDFKVYFTLESNYNENQNKLESFSKVYFTLDSNYKFKSKTEKQISH